MNEVSLVSPLLDRILEVRSKYMTELGMKKNNAYKRKRPKHVFDVMCQYMHDIDESSHVAMRDRILNTHFQYHSTYKDVNAVIDSRPGKPVILLFDKSLKVAHKHEITRSSAGINVNSY